MVHSKKYLSKKINKMHPPTTLYGMSPFTLMSLQILTQYYCRLQKYTTKAFLIIADYDKRESVCVYLLNLLGTICIFGNCHTVFFRCLGSSQQVFNSAHFSLLVSVVICDVKTVFCARFSQTAGNPQFFLSSSLK